MEPRKVSVGYFETTDDMRKLVEQVLDTGRVSYGPLCTSLEEEFADIHGTKHGIVSASGTDSLRAALHAMKIINGWKDGAGVVVPATTFVATSNIVSQVGLTPVLVDVEPDHYCMNPDDLSRTLQEAKGSIVAVAPVNLLGQPAALADITETAAIHGALVLEDSAEAMFVRHFGQTVGSWGDAAGFSFYMAHLITAGVGGITTTDADDIAQVTRSLLNHGRKPIYFSIDDDDGLVGEELREMVSGRFEFLHPGYSSRMTELQAALALPQLRDYKSMLARRREVASKLTAGLSRWTSKLQLPAARPASEHSWMMYGIRVRDGDKMPLVMHLERNGVETRDLLPLVNQPVYGLENIRQRFPVSVDLIESAFYIGCHQGMTDEDVQWVCDVVDSYYMAHTMAP